MATALEEPQTEEAETSGRRMDPELKVMSAMLRLLDDLPALAQPRVVAWLNNRFQMSQIDTNDPRQ